MKTIKRIISIAAACAMLTDMMVFPAAADDRQTVTISAENSMAVFEGWGTGLGTWAERTGGSEGAVNKAVELLYGDDGLRMNIIRYNVGGGDAPSHSHFIDSSAVVRPWWKAGSVDEEKLKYKFDEKADAAQMAVLKKAAAAAGGKAEVELYSYSPPYFMTVSGCTTGAVYSGDNNVRKDCYDNYAYYLAGTAELIEKAGVTVHSIAPMNEPSSLHWKAYGTRQEGCHISGGADQSKLVTELRKALDKKKMDNVIIGVSDEADTACAAQSLGAMTGDALRSADRVNVHSTESADTEAYLEAAGRRSTWITEADGLYNAGEDAGEMSAALGLGRCVIADLNNTHASAWVMWQAVTEDPPAADGSCLGLVCGAPRAEMSVLSQRYYAFGQFSRYISPSSMLIKVDDERIAAYDSDSDTLAVVAVNDSSKSIPVRFELEGFDIEKSGNVTAVRTSGTIADGEHWAEKENAAKLYRTGFHAELAADSVTTYIISGVKLRPDGRAGDTNGDGNVNVTDASLAAAHVKSVKALPAAEKLRADVNADGVVNVTDISLIAAHIKGVRMLPEEIAYTDDEFITDEETTYDETSTDGE